MRWAVAALGLLAASVVVGSTEVSRLAQCQESVASFAAGQASAAQGDMTNTLHVAWSAMAASRNLTLAAELVDKIVDSQLVSGMIPWATWPADLSPAAASHIWPPRDVWVASGDGTEVTAAPIMAPPILAQTALHIYAMVTNDTAGLAASSGLTSDQVQAIVDRVIRSSYRAAHTSLKHIMEQRTAPTRGTGPGADGADSAGRLMFLVHPWESLLPTSPTWSVAAGKRNASSAGTACPGTPPPIPAWVNASSLFDAELWGEQYCLIQCGVTHKFNPADMLAACPLAAAPVVDNALLHMELSAAATLSQVLFKEKEEEDELFTWRGQVGRGIRYGLSASLPVPGLGQADPFSSTALYFLDGLAAHGVDVASSAFVPVTLLDSLVLGGGAAGLAITPDVGDKVEVGGTDTWTSQVATMLLSSAFMPSPLTPTLSRQTGAGVVVAGYAGQPVAFDPASLGYGPVWLRLNWILARAATIGSLPSLPATLLASTADLVCNNTAHGFPAPAHGLPSAVPGVFNAVTGLPAPFPAATEGEVDASAIASLVLGPQPPPIVAPRRPAAIVGLAIAVAAELIFVMAVGAGCIAVGIRFMRDVTTGDRATLDMVARMNAAEEYVLRGGGHGARPGQLSTPAAPKHPSRPPSPTPTPAVPTVSTTGQGGTTRPQPAAQPPRPGSPSIGGWVASLWSGEEGANGGPSTPPPPPTRTSSGGSGADDGEGWFDWGDMPEEGV